MANVVRVNPRSKVSSLEKCPHCGARDPEFRPDGAYLCKTCYYVTKPRVNTSLLQSWSPSIFNLERAGPPPEELVRGSRLALVGGLLFLVAVAIAASPLQLSGLLGRLLDPPPPSDLAFYGGVTIVTVLALVVLFSGYTMSRGDPKAWRATFPAGLIGLILGLVGPGGAVGALGGLVAAAGGWIARHGED